MQEHDDAPQDPEIRPLPTDVICHHCMAENGQLDHLCRKCGTPLTPFAGFRLFVLVR